MGKGKYFFVNASIHLFFNCYSVSLYYRFLFDNQSPAHIYYRWKLFSILNVSTHSSIKRCYKKYMLAQRETILAASSIGYNYNRFTLSHIKPTVVQLLPFVEKYLPAHTCLGSKQMLNPFPLEKIAQNKLISPFATMFSTLLSIILSSKSSCCRTVVCGKG